MKDEHEETPVHDFIFEKIPKVIRYTALALMVLALIMKFKN